MTALRLKQGSSQLHPFADLSRAEQSRETWVVYSFWSWVACHKLHHGDCSCPSLPWHRWRCWWPTITVNQLDAGYWMVQGTQCSAFAWCWIPKETENRSKLRNRLVWWQDMSLDCAWTFLDKKTKNISTQDTHIVIIYAIWAWTHVLCKS